MNKKKIIIIGILTILVITLVFFGTKLLSKNNKIDYDYTQLEDEEIFYQSIDKIYSPLLSDYNIIAKGDTTKNYVKFTFIDKTLKPIPEAKIEIYDENDEFILTANANNDGKIAINNLEFNKTYKFKQVETRKGLLVDNTTYTMKIENKNTGFSEIVVNDENELTSDEKEKYVKEYKEQDKKESNLYKYTVDSEERVKEENSVSITDNKFIFLKDKLSGEILNVTLDYPVEKENDKNNLYNKCIVRISNAFIEKCEVEILDNDENKVKIVDLEYNEKNEFNNGESFYIQTTDVKDIDNVNFKFTITFKYEGETYKVVKTTRLKSDATYNYSYGRIEAMFYKDGTTEPWVNGKVILERLEGSKNITLIGTTRTGTDGKITFYNVAEGKYKLTKVEDKEIIDSKTFNVVEDETTNVEF